VEKLLQLEKQLYGENPCDILKNIHITDSISQP